MSSLPNADTAAIRSDLASSLSSSKILININSPNTINMNQHANVIHLSHHHQNKLFAFNSNDLAARSWIQTLIDSSHLITFVISISVIIYGSFRSLNIDRKNEQHQQNESNEASSSLDESSTTKCANKTATQHQPVQTINSSQALLIPVAASISLLIMFFFFDSIQTAFVICTSILATVAFSFLFSPICEILIKSCAPKYLSSYVLNKKISCCFAEKFTLPQLFAFILSSSLVILWILTGHWLLMDLIGVGFCVTFIAIVRLPSLKVSTLLLVGLVIYDVLWVYFSHLIFNSSVMIKVATKEADNPMGILARKFNIENNSPKLSLPGKLIVPSYQHSGNFSILGLGDIVIPGLLLCFVLRFDAYKRSQLYQLILQQENKAINLQEATKKCNKAEDEACNCLDCKLNDHKSCNMDVDNITKKTNQYEHMEHSATFPFLLNKFNKTNNPNQDIKYSIRNILRFNKFSYFQCSLIGYFVGLITATLSSEIFKEAQPALLYLVPFTLLPLLIMAYFKGDLHLMWNEPFSTKGQNYFYV